MENLINFFDPTCDTYKGNPIPYSVKRLLKAPFQFFIFFFVSGSLLLLFYLVTKNNNLLIIGAMYTAIAILANLLFVLLYIGYALHHRDYWDLILQKASILLLNIPVTILYIYSVANY